MAKRPAGFDYEKEILEAVARMRKYAEHKRSARNSDTWIEFLDNIGVYPSTYESEKGSEFWEKVRQKVEYKPDWREPVRKEGITKTGEKWREISYRDKSGKFVSYESLGIPKPVKKEPNEKQLLEANVYKSYTKSGRFMGYRDYETGKIQKIK